MNKAILDWMADTVGPVNHWTKNMFAGDGWHFKVLYVDNGTFEIEMSFDDELLALEFKLKWL